MAIYGSADVDVTTIDEASIVYAGATPVRCAIEDAFMEMPDGSFAQDGIPDLVCKFKKSEMDLPQPGDDCETIEIAGTFDDGLKWAGSDHICVPGDPVCEAGTPQ